MHDLISIAVPTRHRPGLISRFVETLNENTRKDCRPHLTILYDAPIKQSKPNCNYNGDTQEVTVFEKKGLTSLYNMGIILSPTDWVFLCSDDVFFNEGWLEYLEEKIAEGKYLAVHLFHYGAVLLHKSLILTIGWFDERFNFGGYEDLDHQVRAHEAGLLLDHFDMSHDFIKNVGGVQVGHFMSHQKTREASGEAWIGDNSIWMREKWGSDRREPFTRKHREIDWYPKYTEIYSKKFNTPRKWKTPHE